MLADDDYFHVRYMESIHPELRIRRLEQQGWKCYNCGKPFQYLKLKDEFPQLKCGKYGEVLDHDHKTRKVRGLACIECNKVL
jgi:DNA-directed RNA polymerase subunit RPC12/RpoP